jgi:putative acetyltransferase
MRNMTGCILAIEAVTAENAAGMEALRQLWREYAEHLLVVLGPDHVCMRDFETSLSDLPGEHSPPYGALLLAAFPDGFAGCVGMRPVQPGDGTRAGEIRRMWVRPSYRGRGVGRALLEAAVDSSRRAGYSAVYLDTVLDQMPEAAALYRSAGFVECARYNGNVIPGIHFFRMNLHDGIEN